jgi:flagellar FliL protein
MAEETAELVAARRLGGPALLLGVGVAMALALAGTWWLARPQVAARARARAAQPAVGALLPLEPFIANLADVDGKRYLTATLQAEFFDARVPHEFEARLPLVRDLLLTLFTSKLFAEVRTPEGKARLREEIVTRMNRALGRDLVKAVYFTEFIVQ